MRMPIPMRTRVIYSDPIGRPRVGIIVGMRRGVGLYVQDSHADGLIVIRPASELIVAPA